MSDNKEKIITTNESGSINYANDVLAKIAALATDEVVGVLGISGGGLSDMLGVKNRGIHVTLEENTAVIDINIIVEYGKKLHVVSNAVQDSIKKAIESMTSLKVIAVNVNVSSIHVEKPKEVEEEKQPKK
ncbi:MAG: Asp23/Gls24 family envelope stress response protein [Clostridiales bacterium]|nr:Asp23/Gls24 family envelope stress response protein [Clostridiales bacterium]